MRRVSYKSVLDKVASLFLGEQAPGADDAATMGVFINMRAGRCWEKYWFPELCPSEERQFRPNWSAADTYGAPTATTSVERYYPKAGKYYQSLHAANLNNAPATGSGSSLTENSAHWAECAASYSEDVEWATDVEFTVGLKALNPDDQRIYQCHTAHTAGATFDATKFGILTPFVRDIDYEQTGETKIGEVRHVWPCDPEAHEVSPGWRIPFSLRRTGIVVRGELPVVWVEFRLRVPSWTGSNYNALTTYAADAQAYDPTEGDFFKSVQAANIGHAVTDTVWWERIEFPYVLRDCVAQLAFADMVRVDREGEEQKGWVTEERIGVQMLDAEIMLIEKKQSQGGQLNVRTRDSAVQ